MWIRNVSMQQVQTGDHPPAHVLIQIVDPDMDYPPSAQRFQHVFQQKFLDTNDADYASAFNPSQAAVLVNVLNWALQHSYNVIVHCVAGLCRSGAVCEVGVMMGFDDTGAVRIPNILVKQRLMHELGWTYCSENE